MKTKTLRLLSVGMAFLFLASILSAFCMTGTKAEGSKTDGKISASSTNGSFGRLVTVYLTMPSDDAVTYNYEIFVDDDSVSSGTNASPSAEVNCSFNTSKAKHVVTAKITDSDSTECPVTGVDVTSQTPVIKVSKSVLTYAPTLTASFEIENPISGVNPTVKDSKGNTVVPSGDGTKWTFGIPKAEVYTIEYKNADSKTITVAKASANLVIKQDRYQVYIGNNITVDYTMDSDATEATASVNPSSLVVNTPVTGSKANVSVTAGPTKGTGTITVKVDETDNYLAGEDSANFVVYDSSVPMISASPNPIYMDKSNPTQKVTITLTNPKVESSGYAKVIVKMVGPSNAYNGVYIDGYRKKAGNTYAVAVGSGLSTSFDVTLKARRSATYYLQIENGSEVEKIPVVVTGFSSLPQTGPDFTLVYVFAGLLLFAGAGLVVVNILKKKNNGVN